MKAIYLDCISGISGNMFLGACIQAGVPTNYLRFIDNLIKEIYKHDDGLSDEDYIKKLGFSCSNSCEFKLILKNNRLYLFEQTRNECWDLGFSEIF